MGGREIPRNPPGTRNIGDKSVISRKSRERRLGPPETVICEGTVKTNYNSCYNVIDLN